MSDEKSEVTEEVTLLLPCIEVSVSTVMELQAQQLKQILSMKKDSDFLKFPWFLPLHWSAGKKRVIFKIQWQMKDFQQMNGKANIFINLFKNVDIKKDFKLPALSFQLNVDEK